MCNNVVFVPPNATFMKEVSLTPSDDSVYLQSSALHYSLKDTQSISSVEYDDWVAKQHGGGI